MNETSVFDFGNLLIWVPGLLFFVAILAALIAQKRGGNARAITLAGLALFVICLLIAVLVPMNQISRALEFAQAYEPYDGPEITSYADIPFGVRNAWRETALPEEERSAPAGGGDIFDFGPAGAQAPAAQGPAGEPAGAAEGPDLTYDPQQAVAWWLLIFFFIPGIIVFVQDRLVFPGGRRGGG